MERRTFIKKGCVFCVGAMAGISLLTLAESCATGKIVKKEALDNKITVPATDFVPGESFIIVRAPSLSYDILLHRKQDDSYNALFMQCTHYDNPVYANKKEIFCPSHGSKFDFNGNVTKEPASRNLKQFRTEKNNQDIIIYIS